MAQVPALINGVIVEFAPGVVNDVHQRVVDGLSTCIKTNLVAAHPLHRIYVSSAFDSHTLPSRHMQHKAVDVSRINGVKVAIGYPQGGAAKAIVNAIQTAFEGYAHRRENFGPHFKKKLGQPFSVSGHSDHVHLSVD